MGESLESIVRLDYKGDNTLIIDLVIDYNAFVESIGLPRYLFITANMQMV